MNLMKRNFKKFSDYLNYYTFKLTKYRKLFNLRHIISLEIILNKYRSSYSNIIVPFKNSLPLIKFNQNPILKEGKTTEWDEAGIYEPYLLFDGKKYFFYYESYSFEKEKKWQIGVATANKITGPWEKYHNNPILRYTNQKSDYDNECIADPCVIYHNGKYHMWVDMFDGKTWRIGKAYSDDGLTWNKLRKNGSIVAVLDVGKKGSWDDNLVHCPEVYLWNNRYHMLYGAIGIGHIYYDTGLAIQADDESENFNKWGQVTTDEMLGPNYIISRLQAGFMLNSIIISGLRVSEKKGMQETYMVFSDDGGKSWYKLSDPILNRGANNEWDKNIFYGPNCWLIAENKLWTGYLGGVNNVPRRLGLAYMKIPKII